MAIINRLDANLTNMIAAGEVVERPSGIVKELVENAIDAQAKRIDIDITQGGIESIVVSDDGVGMDEHDANLAFERHATSKIKKVEDLWKIKSLGFRGEALPSIASVSKVNLKTNDGSGASEIIINYGEKVKSSKCAFDQGTRIEVRNLFQKMPARFKHLKSPNYEFALISDVVNKFALANPNIAFSLNHNGNEILKSRGNNNLLEVILQEYDRSIASNALKMEISDNDYQIEGYIVSPNISRASKYYINVFVNERMIRSYKLNQAIIKAYDEYLPNNRYPLVFINIKMDANLIDVNVHPSKWEVRFSKEPQLINLVSEGIKETLKQAYEVNTVKKAKTEQVENNTLDFTYHPTSIKEVTPVYEYHNEEVTINKTENKPEIVEPLVKEEPTKKPNTIFDELIVIGQLHKAYILCSAPSGLYIIDQHAAQERYHYEQIQEAILNKPKDSQELLHPLEISATTSLVSNIDRINEGLIALGIKLEVFGPNSFIVRILPTWLNDLDAQAFLNDLLDIYLKEESIDEAKLRKHAIATAACHSSIRFNRSLNLEEMKQVIVDLSNCKQPFHCPHGRPTMIEYTLKDLEKDFLRVK